MRLGQEHLKLPWRPWFLAKHPRIPSFPCAVPSCTNVQKWGESLEQFPCPSFCLYPAHSDLNLTTTLTSLFSSYYFSSSLNVQAYPLYSEIVYSSRTFRSRGSPGNKSLQTSSRQFSRIPNTPVLPGQASSSEWNIAVGHTNAMAVSSSTPLGGPMVIKSLDHLQRVTSSKIPGYSSSWCSSFGLPELLGMWEHSFGISYLVLSPWVLLT